MKSRHYQNLVAITLEDDVVLAAVLGDSELIAAA